LRIQQLEQLKNQLTNAGEQQMVQELINALTQQQIVLNDYLSNEEQYSSLWGKIVRLFSRKPEASPSPNFQLPVLLLRQHQLQQQLRLPH